VQQLLDLCRRQPAAAVREPCRDDRGGAVAVDVVESRQLVGRAREPAAVRERAPQRPHRLLGRREPWRPTCAERRRVGAHEDRQHGLRRAVPGRGVDDRHDLGGGHRERAREQHDRRVDAGIRQHQLERALVVRGAGERGQVERVGDDRAVRGGGGECGLRGLPQLRHAEARGGAGVGALDAEPAGVGEHRDALAARCRLPRQQPGEVEHLAQRVGADDARVLEQRVDVGVGRRQQRGDVRLALVLRRRRAAALDRDHRLDCRHAARDLAEAARVAERLEVEQHDVGARIGLPELEQVVAR
jgi:hypothetical protein